MTLPAIFIVFVFNYLPLVGLTMAFKSGRGAQELFGGTWVGLKNFEFFFKSQDAARITYNTVFMNSIFIITTLLLSLTIAILLNESRSRRLVKSYQTILMLPYFLSWVIMGFLAFAFLSVDNGFINGILSSLGLPRVNWYSEPRLWPGILAVSNLIKVAGYTSVIYYAGIMGIDETLYEAAKIDGANRFYQILHITIPLLTPLISIMTLLQIGKIFYSDFGLFYYLPRETGVLFSTTDVIDTYAYRALRVLGNTGMAAAIGVFQSLVGFIFVITSNFIVSKINPENSLF
jgi:putative aldouronate transport system permease protein